jgi:hypothetical protein
VLQWRECAGARSRFFRKKKKLSLLALLGQKYKYCGCSGESAPERAAGELSSKKEVN